MFEFGAVAAVIGGNGVSDLRTSLSDHQTPMGTLYRLNANSTVGNRRVGTNRSWRDQLPVEAVG